MTLRNTLTCAIGNKMSPREKSHSKTEIKFYHLSFINTSISVLFSSTTQISADIHTPEQADKTSHCEGNFVLVWGADLDSGWSLMQAPFSQKSWPNLIWANTQVSTLCLQGQNATELRILTKHKLL